MIKLENVYKNYGSLQVLKNISLEVAQGEVVVVIGPSGSGKSTLLRTINGLETIEGGQVLINDFSVHASQENLHKARQLTGMVFQQFNLFNNKNDGQVYLASAGSSKSESITADIKKSSDGINFSDLIDIEIGEIGSYSLRYIRAMSQSLIESCCFFLCAHTL